ncbi:MAG TPA: GlsB/YeaQ/YmgE family stress response membrane protein [Pyrinomonadaceae bacterium]|nr:GlsB/YeaQ/YmgE family stress response membrane protein [Pyrinomonadaceae bacterium]
MIFNIISWIVFGLIVGAIARLFVRNDGIESWTMTIILGIAGSFVGGILSSLLFGNKGESFVRYSGWIMSIIGAIILLLLKRWLF